VSLFIFHKHRHHHQLRTAANLTKHTRCADCCCASRRAGRAGGGWAPRFGRMQRPRVGQGAGWAVGLGQWLRLQSHGADAKRNLSASAATSEAARASRRTRGPALSVQRSHASRRQHVHDGCEDGQSPQLTWPRCRWRVVRMDPVSSRCTSVCSLPPRRHRSRPSRALQRLAVALQDVRRPCADARARVLQPSQRAQQPRTAAHPPLLHARTPLGI
jgi:hypothetical protein